MTLPPPAPRTWSVNDLVSAALLNTNIRDAVNFLTNPPTFVGYQATGQAIPTSVWTGMAIDSNVTDTYNGHSTVTNNTRYVAQQPGWYAAMCDTVWPSAAGTGRRGSEIYKNGAAPLYRNEILVGTVSSGGTPSITLVQLAVADYVEGRCFQDSGASATLGVGSSLQVWWVHA